jgi:hypothetical protein
MPSSETNLSTTYWVSKDSLKDNNRNGVCRVLIGDHNSGGSYEMYPGTWRGMNGTCSYVDARGVLKSINPSVPSGSNVVVEVLSGLDIGDANSTGSWKNTSGGIPVDTAGQNAYPPKPKFSAFLAGGNVNHAPLYLCRVKNSTDQTWRYGYQTISSQCTTDTGTATIGSAQSLVFTTVKNTSP